MCQEIWCRWGDLNSHARRRCILNAVCMRSITAALVPMERLALSRLAATGLKSVAYSFRHIGKTWWVRIELNDRGSHGSHWFTASPRFPTSQRTQKWQRVEHRSPSPSLSYPRVQTASPATLAAPSVAERACADHACPISGSSSLAKMRFYRSPISPF